jgi:hypothetical protein
MLKNGHHLYLVSIARSLKFFIECLNSIMDYLLAKDVKEPLWAA